VEKYRITLAILFAENGKSINAPIILVLKVNYTLRISMIMLESIFDYLLWQPICKMLEKAWLSILINVAQSRL